MDRQARTGRCTRRGGRLWVVAAVLAALTPEAGALINPRFTPIDLVTQSELILALEVGPAGAKGDVPVRLVACVKGKAPAGTIRLDLSKTAAPQAEALRRTVGATARRLALLFAGKYREEEDDDAGGGEPEEDGEGTPGLLHVEGQWFRLFRKQAGGPWLLDVVDERKQSTWAGGTDMLRRAVRYVLTDPNPHVPVRTGAAWGEHKRIGRLEGKAHGAAAVDLAADGRLALFVACESGDRVFRWDRAKKAFADLSPTLELGAKSHAAAWADFNGDGRLDLASWDGNALGLWLQTEKGTFEADARKTALAAGCIGLAVLDVGVKGRPGMLASTRDVPVLLTPRADGSFAVAPIVGVPAGKSPVAAIGTPHRCLVADLDGDRIPDVLQPGTRGTLFYKGVRPGVFALQGRRAVATGEGHAAAFLGDYDADGLLDVFVGAEERCGLWQNRGGAAFAEALGLSGEAAYISKPNARGGATGDVNDDGRQDVLILYADRPPQIFFNRGFRSFGHSHRLDLAENALLPAAAKGQQAGLLADLDGDGAQDMALVLANGEVWVFFREVADDAPLSLRAALPLGGPVVGPVTVTGWLEKRCLGAWNVVAGSSEAFLALLEPGPCTVRWQWPGGTAHEKEIILEDGPKRLLLGR